MLFISSVRHLTIFREQASKERKAFDERSRIILSNRHTFCYVHCVLVFIWTGRKIKRTEFLPQLCPCNSFQQLTDLGQPLLRITGWPWGILISPAASLPLLWSGLEKHRSPLLMAANGLWWRPVWMALLPLTLFLLCSLKSICQSLLSPPSTLLVTSPSSCILHLCLFLFNPHLFFTWLWEKSVQVFPLEAVAISFVITCYWLPIGGIHLGCHVCDTLIQRGNRAWLHTSEEKFPFPHKVISWNSQNEFYLSASILFPLEQFSDWGSHTCDTKQLSKAHSCRIHVPNNYEWANTPGSSGTPAWKEVKWNLSIR